MQRMCHVPCRALLGALFVGLAGACVKVAPQKPGPVPGPVPLSPSWRETRHAAPARTAAAPAPEPPRMQNAEQGLARDVVFAIQIRLDRAGCSTGGIDGRWGPKTASALAAWQEMNGLPPTGKADGETLRRIGTPDEALWTTDTLTAADRASLRPYPAAWTERAQLDAMGFVTLRELAAERNHLFESALEALNPGAGWPNPPDGTVLRVPDIRTRSLPPVHRLEISVSAKTVRAYGADGRLVAHFPCSIAADRAKRPVGRTLHVAACADRPEYTFDPALFADDPSAAALTKRLRIPPGPNNPVGLAWIGLDLPGYGIHGTPAPEKISHTESHGCFRLTNWDAQRLLKAIRPSASVDILP